MQSKKTLLQWLGLLGVMSFISYAVAVIFAPIAYPGYDWMRQAVSDLSALDAPSYLLWTQLSSLFAPAGIVSIMAVCIAIQGKLNNTLRLGVYMFAIMNWVSIVGFTAFPLSESGLDGRAFQDIAHLVVTAAVVISSLASFVLIMVGGYGKKRFVSLAIYATIALVLMLVGPLGLAFAPEEYFGLFQRFSNMIAANGFGMALGLYLFLGKFDGK